MTTRRRIVVADLDAPIRSIVDDCLPLDHFELVEFDKSREGATTAHVDLVVFRSPKTLERTEALCATLRSHVGQATPLLCCASRYVYPLIKKILGNSVQSMIIMPFDASGFRQKLDELELGF